MASCNGCDRIIFEDENDMPSYTASHGYCRECRREQWQQGITFHIDNLLNNLDKLTGRMQR